MLPQNSKTKTQWLGQELLTFSLESLNQKISRLIGFLTAFLHLDECLRVVCMMCVRSTVNIGILQACLERVWEVMNEETRGRGEGWTVCKRAAAASC